MVVVDWWLWRWWSGGFGNEGGLVASVVVNQWLRRWSLDKWWITAVVLWWVRRWWRWWVRRWWRTASFRPSAPVNPKQNAGKSSTRWLLNLVCFLSSHGHNRNNIINATISKTTGGHPYNAGESSGGNPFQHASSEMSPAPATMNAIEKTTLNRTSRFFSRRAQ
nr:hypothetical protein Iba_chr03bCG6290 [Ipomoea batatas]